MVAGKAAGNPRKKRQTGPKDPAGAEAQEAAQTAAPVEHDTSSPSSAEAPAPMGHNSSIGELDEDERISLMYVHSRALEEAMDAAASANGTLRSVRKKIKAEGNDPAQIEMLVKVRKNRAHLLTLVAKAQQIQKVVTLESRDYNFQVDLFKEEDVSSIDRARHEGIRACRMEQAANGGRYDPQSPEYRAWLDAYQEEAARHLAAKERAARRIREGIRPLEPTPLEEMIAATESTDQQDDTLISEALDGLQDPPDVIPFPGAGAPGGPTYTVE